MEAVKNKQSASVPVVREARMKLSAVTTGKVSAPIRLLVTGVEGVGKTTLAANAPAPIFLAAEDGTASVDVARFPEPESWSDVLDALAELTSADHPYKTLAIDSIDWLEPIIWQDVCQQAKVANIEEVGGGYGKGYVSALERWRVFLATLDRLRKAKGMHVILIGHVAVRNFKNPLGADFDRLELKINQKAAGIVKEWCDAVLFANYETFAEKDSRTKRVKGISTGARYLYTQHTAAYDAKNRYDLPSQLPLNWDDLYAAIREHNPADAGKLKEAIAEKMAQITDASLREQIEKSIAKAPENAAHLAKINDRLNAKLAEMGE